MHRESFIARTAAERIARLSAALRVVIVNGPRQSGKTTLLKEHLRTHSGSYRSLDSPIELERARKDPLSYAVAGEMPRIIDEVQRGGDDLVRAIKIAVDESPKPGSFILSGSSRFLTIPTLSESLAGRAVFVDMWPLAMSERVGGPTNFIDKIFTNLGEESAHSETSWHRSDYIDVILTGGFPEATELTDPLAQASWYNSYLTTVINRDIVDFADIHRASLIPRILALLAARAGSPMVQSDLARSTELSWEATRNYVSYLDMVFLTITVPAWSKNLTSRITKTPKVFLCDSGLASHLLEVDQAGLEAGHPALGGLLETFVASELTKLLSFANTRASLWHLRDRSGPEVDFLLEKPDGTVIGIEVKATTTPRSDSARHLRWVQGKLGDQFAGGIVLHLGSTGGSLGGGIHLLPLSALWGHVKGNLT